MQKMRAKQKSYHLNVFCRGKLFYPNIIKCTAICRVTLQIVSEQRDPVTAMADGIKPLTIGWLSKSSTTVPLPQTEKIQLKFFFSLIYKNYLAIEK